MSYVHPDNVLVLSAILLVLAWTGFLADASRFGKAVPGVLCILVLGMSLSNLHIAPYASPVGNFVNHYLVAAAIPLLMIKADFKRIFVESGRVMLGFGAACIGTVVATIVAYLLMQPWHVPGSIAGTYAGGWIGGTISMVAVADTLKVSAPDFAAAISASMIPSVVGLMLLIALPAMSLVRRYMAPAAEPSSGTSVDSPLGQEPSTMRLTHISGALALSFCIVALAHFIAHEVSLLIGRDQSEFVLLYVTAITVIIANVASAPLQRLRGDFELGMLFMYLFFGVIGLGTNLTAFLDHAVSLFFFSLLLIVVAVMVSMILCRLLRLNIAESITGIGSAIVGPPATVAVVAGKGWYSMVTPAVMIGIFCHVVGTFVGIAIGMLLH